MNKKAILALGALALLTPIIASCGGNSGTTSSEQPVVSSEEPIISSEEPIVSSEEPVVSSEEADPYAVDGAITVDEAIRLVSRAGLAYGGKGYQALLDATKEACEYFPEDTAAPAHERDVIALFYKEFEDITATEQRVGARSIQSTPNIYKAKGNEKPAINYLSQTLRIYTPSHGTEYSGQWQITKDYVLLLADRMHAYLGKSEKDDFFATVNHDYLYKDAPTGKTGDSVYETNLISETAINDWVKEQTKTFKNAADWQSCYYDAAQKTSGQLGGLTAALQPILDAETTADFLDKVVEFTTAYGYCPLFGDLGTTVNSIFGQREVLITVAPYDYDYDASYTKESSNYSYSVERFSKVFAAILGNEAKGKTAATNYSDYKYELGLKIKEGTAKTNQYFKMEKEKTYGPSELNLYEYFVRLGFGNPEKLLFPNAAAMEGFLNLLDDEHLPMIKGMALWSAADHYAGALAASTMTDWMGYDFTDPSIQNQEFNKNVAAYVQYPLAKYFLESEYGQSQIDAATNLLSSLKASLKARINAEDSFLSDKSKTAATEKINNVLASIATKGAPSKLPYFDPDFVSAEEGGTYFGNMALFDKEYRQYLESIAVELPQNRLNNFMYYVMAYEPLEANAFYLPGCNAIVITLGYMAAYPNIHEMSNEQLLASYGWVMGHELSHGFDENGVRYNKIGDQLKIFTTTDLNNYKRRTQKVAKYYDGNEVMPGQATPGSIVSAEATADICGMRLCLDIAKGIEGFDYQTYFREAAANFGAYASQTTYEEYLKPDEHPFGRTRVNRCLAAQDEFYEAFNIQEGDNMYVAPGDRPVIY